MNGDGIGIYHLCQLIQDPGPDLSVVPPRYFPPEVYRAQHPTTEKVSSASVLQSRPLRATPMASPSSEAALARFSLILLTLG